MTQERTSPNIIIQWDGDARRSQSGKYIIANCVYHIGKHAWRRRVLFIDFTIGFEKTHEVIRRLQEQLGKNVDIVDPQGGLITMSRTIGVVIFTGISVEFSIVNHGEAAALLSKEFPELRIEALHFPMSDSGGRRVEVLYPGTTV